VPTTINPKKSGLTTSDFMNRISTKIRAESNQMLAIKTSNELIKSSQ